MIERKTYLNKLINLKDKQLIKVISGVRRCGKSTLLKQYMDYLLKCDVKKDHIIFYNLDDIANEDLLDYKVLYKTINNLIKNEDRYYIFLDEIQNVDSFQKAIDSLFLKDNVDIYITGSNSYMLSSEISTLLTGRYIVVEMLPLSFKEYASTFKDQNNLESIYSSYISTSSFPYALELKDNEEVLNAYLESLFNTIFVNDILNRKKVSDPMMLKSILRYLFSNIGSQISSNKIANTLTSMGRKIDSRTVDNYLNALIESNIVYEAKRYNICGKEYLKTLNKYYIVDMGLRKMLLGDKHMDYGHMLENVIYLELIKRGYRVFVGKVEREEVDFVCQKQNEEMYVQVALTVRDETTLKRELKPLLAIKDNYPKLLLTLDNEPSSTINGILKLNALKWLIDE